MQEQSLSEGGLTLLPMEISESIKTTSLRKFLRKPERKKNYKGKI
jgi:hypothetical protein